MIDGDQDSTRIKSVTLPNSDLLSERELARLLGKSLRTIRRWSVERRAPPKVKLGKSVFYRRESVLIESRIISCQSRQREDCFQKAVIKRGLRRMRRSVLRARSSSSQ